MNHLTNFVKEYYEQETIHVDMSSGGGCVNKYDVPTNPDRTCRESPAARAEKETNQLFANNNYLFLPKMKAHRTLGTVHERGQPRQPVQLGSMGSLFWFATQNLLFQEGYLLNSFVL